MLVMMATQGAALVPGRVLPAPGGWQTRVQHFGESRFTQLTAGIPDDVCLASLGVLFASAARRVESDAGAVVLTAMDCLGPRPLAAAGGTLWAQNKAGNAILGMPAALLRTGLAAAVISARALALRWALAR